MKWAKKRGERNIQMLMTSQCGENEETQCCVCRSRRIWTMHRGHCRLSCEVWRETSSK